MYKTDEYDPSNRILFLILCCFRNKFGKIGNLEDVQDKWMCLFKPNPVDNILLLGNHENGMCSLRSKYLYTFFLLLHNVATLRTNYILRFLCAKPKLKCFIWNLCLFVTCPSGFEFNKLSRWKILCDFIYKPFMKFRTWSGYDRAFRYYISRQVLWEKCCKETHLAL
jgi:hypothetical protein